jgi:hypothetical protein
MKGRLRLLGHVERVPVSDQFSIPNELGRQCSRISQKDKYPLESEERDGWAILKMM